MSFSKKDLGEAAYILSIKIYRDRSRRLISFSMSTYLDKILKQFKMEQSKKEFLPVLQGVKLSKTQNPTSAISFIKYSMLCTRPIVYLAMSLARGYDSDPGVDHWSLHTLLAPLGLTKPSGCIIYNSSLINPLRNAVLFIHLPDFRKCGNC